MKLQSTKKFRWYKDPYSFQIFLEMDFELFHLVDVAYAVYTDNSSYNVFGIIFSLFGFSVKFYFGKKNEE